MIELKELKIYLECDDEFVLEIVSQFKMEATICLDEIIDASHRSDINEIARTSHRMLSSTRILKFDELSAILEKLEGQSIWNQTVYTDLIARFQSNLTICLEEISALEKQLTKSD